MVCKFKKMEKANVAEMTRKMNAESEKIKEDGKKFSKHKKVKKI